MFAFQFCFSFVSFCFRFTLLSGFCMFSPKFFSFVLFSCFVFPVSCFVFCYAYDFILGLGLSYGAWPQPKWHTS